MCAAATDLARLLAALSWRDKRNPMLSPESVDALLGNCLRATMALTGPHAHGFFGYDMAWRDTDGSLVACKGGWLGGNQSFAWTSTSGDGMGVVLLINTNEQDDSTASFGVLLNDVVTFAAAHAWSLSADLFPDFGMPPLIPKPVVRPPPLLRATQPSAKQRIVLAAAAERASMTRRPDDTARSTRRRRR
jgi:hypothetical protein